MDQNEKYLEENELGIVENRVYEITKIISEWREQNN
jgi:hypothetical protein